MKGMVFCLLNEMVEEKFGIEAWDTLLDATGFDGIYVATETYDDAELMSLVSAASEATGIQPEELVKQFGEYMIPSFLVSYPMFFQGHANLKSFLLTVDQVIHVEVRKLYPEAGLPEFKYTDKNDSELTMHYSSPRKLCALAEGLISGSAKHFKQEYNLLHEVCMHDGDDHCELQIKML
ncbi:MAG: heme NO-binding domain-containing protein [Pseudomonadota bacterium]